MSSQPTPTSAELSVESAEIGAVRLDLSGSPPVSPRRTATLPATPETRPTSELSSDSSTGSQSPSTSREPTEILASSLRAHTLRLRIAKARIEFEHTLLTTLTLNVIYTYYLDHTILVLAIRASQLIRLFYLPYATPTAQRGTAILLLLSTLPVLLIHKMLFFPERVGEMLFINFIGPEPKSWLKVFAVDCLVAILQAILLQCRWEESSVRVLTALPVPASEPLEPVERPEDT